MDDDIFIGVDNRFKILKKIGEGGFGKVYKAIDTNNNNVEVALKLEDSTSKKKQLIYENAVYNILKNYNEFLNTYYFNMCGNYYVLAIDYVKYNLNHVKKKILKNPKLLCLLAMQLLHNIQIFHEKGIIHRDLKPENILYDKNNNKLYIIDFGLCKKIRSSDNRHIKYYKNGNFLGTLRYCSIHAHQGICLSRRDDIESIAYIMIYLYTGSLPWQNIKHDDKKIKHKLILESKKNTTIDSICKDCPDVVKNLLYHARTLRFKERPLYSLFIDEFRLFLNTLQ